MCRRHPGTSLFLTLLLLSLLGLFVMFITYNQRLSVQLKENEDMNHQLRITLTRQIADRIDSDLCQIAIIPHTMAATLSLRKDWTKEQLYLWMRQMLAKDSRLYGTCVAFEPREFDNKEEFAPYVYWKDPRTVDEKPITYAYRDMGWYKEAKDNATCAMDRAVFR